MSLDSLVKGKNVIAVVCNQWGDTGKGKFSDYFAAHWADVIARGTGGNNAGHTVVINGEKRIFHLIPAGILYDKDGKINILGNGMVIDLDVLCEELEDLENAGISYNNLLISKDAHVITPYQVEKDKAKNGLKNKGIGSTGRGIGPCYEDKIARRGIMISDLFEPNILRKKIKKNKEVYGFTDGQADDFMSHLIFNAEKIKPFVRDNISAMHCFMRDGKNVLLEGAQGLLLSVEYGTYPYVTSSDCSVNGTAAGVGISARAVDLCLGVVKFPYMTRVGNGPFPTECGGRMSEEYCAEELEDSKPKYDMKFEL
jgi:adenylosuccinate synthase